MNMGAFQSVSVMIGSRKVSMHRLMGPYGPLYVIRSGEDHELVHDVPEHAHTLFAWAVRDAKREQGVAA